MPYMYILECSDKSFYVGSTWDLERRLGQHQAGEGARYTARRRPLRLVLLRGILDDAFARGKQVQTWSRAKRIALIEGRHQDIESDMM